MTSFHVVRVGHPYTVRTYSFEGTGKIHGIERSFRMVTDAAIAEENPEDAPLAATLALGEGRIDLRHCGDSFWRPLLAPGTLEPLGFDAFQELALGDTPWRDNPFQWAFDRYHNDGNYDPKPLLDGVKTFQDWEYRKHDSITSREHGEKAQKTVADLLVVGGIVYRKCPEPVLVLKSDGAKPIRLTWHLPHLESDDDIHGPTVIVPREDRPHGRSPGGRKTGPRFVQLSDWRVFPLTYAAEAVAVAGEVARHTKREVAADLGIVEIVRPEFFKVSLKPSVVQDLVKESRHNIEGAVTKMSRSAVMEWLDARDAFYRNDFDGVIERYCRILDMPDDAAKLRWSKFDVVGAHRYHSYGKVADCEADLAGLVRYAVLDRRRPRLSNEDVAALEDIALDEDEGLAGPRL